MGATTNYRFAEPNELTITVTVLGAVRNPGRYEVSRKVDLVNLIALAGGWLDNADLDDVHISRARSTGDKTSRTDIPVYLDEVDEFGKAYVQLQEGDLVYVGATNTATLTIALTIITTAALLINTWAVVENLSR